MLTKQDFKKITDYIWEISKSFRSDMRVPARFYLGEKMIEKILEDETVTQAVNVATLPGIQKYSLVMPDAHSGYGSPIGSVAAFDVKKGIISPGICGYDQNCGVRLLKSQIKKEEIKPYLVNLANQIQRDVPSGLGKGTREKLSSGEIEEVLNKGARWTIVRGFGKKEDLENLEENGCYKIAEAKYVSVLARRRGQDQVGTLGSGNHFMEIQFVDEIFDKKTAEVFGLFENQIVVLIHTGSRGLGHQVATDYIREMMLAMQKYKIEVPDRELACTPFNSDEGKRYFAAMAGAANFAWANRQMITHRVREAFMRILVGKLKNHDLDIVYDVAHNIVKLEKYNGKELIVHRKGATRAFGPGRPEIPEKYRAVGQPVLIPGSMGTASYVLVGTKQAEKETFGSTCHGSGRIMSRKKAKQTFWSQTLRQQLEKQGIIIRCESNVGLSEEAPGAYKDVEDVVEVVHQAGISKKVARLKPLVVIKGE
jgi:tRNA-splicing ligase RtcB